jgi:hypothetical protein
VFIYVIASSSDTVKIGYSADPQRRLGQLQVGHERKLQLVHTEKVDADRAPLLERLIHQANRHRCLHGEWFNLTHEQAIGEVQFAMIRYGEDE